MISTKIYYYDFDIVLIFESKFINHACSLQQNIHVVKLAKLIIRNKFKRFSLATKL